MLKAAILGFTAAFAQAKFADCDPNNDVNDGPFAPANFFNITWEDTTFYGVTPTPTEDQKKFPVMAFMHGTTGGWSMYEPTLNHYASHGFLVVFPHMEGPTEDGLPLTTDTDGEYLLKAIEFAKAANADETSALYGKVDVDNIIIAGDGMGAGSIMASKRFAGTAKLTVAQHPGICGPSGPPPKPATEVEMEDANFVPIQLRNLGIGKCITIPAGQTSSRTKLELQDCVFGKSSQ